MPKAPSPCDIKPPAGVAVNFEMPDTYSISLGGGSLVDPAPLGSVPRIGPASVGNQLLQRAVSFGGTDLTATDLAVRLGRLRLGDASLVAARLSQQQAGAAWEEVQAMVQACIDRMRTSAGELQYHTSRAAPNKRRSPEQSTLG